MTLAKEKELFYNNADENLSCIARESEEIIQWLEDKFSALSVDDSKFGLQLEDVERLLSETRVMNTIAL